MGLSSRKTKAGLFFLAVFLGGALPCLLSLFRSTDALPLALLRSASLAVLVFLAQAAPFWVSLAGGYCVMAGGLLTRLPLLFALPAPVIAYEATTLLLVPLLLLGLTRLWLRMAVGMRLAFLFTAVSLLAVCLLMQVGWSFLTDSLGLDAVGLRAALPDLSGILLSFLVECGVYAVLCVAFHVRDGEMVSI
mgnify:FL=1